MYIDRRASNLVRKYKTNCPFYISRQLNINVLFLDMPESVKGHYQRTLSRRYITINQNLTEEWKRFVCAHELGHDRLHKGTSHHFIKQSTLFNIGVYERQANRFAISLLLSGSNILEDETVDSYFLRNEIPLEMKRYYINF